MTGPTSAETGGVRIAASRAAAPDSGDRRPKESRRAATRVGTPTAIAPPSADVQPQAAAGGNGPARGAARAKVLRQRRRRRRVLMVFTGFTALCTFIVGVGFVYLQRRLDQITRVVLPALSEDVAGEVMNVLLVGSDSRANLSGAEAAGFGQDQVGGQRSDTIMLLHVDPNAQKASIVSVPRDLYVPIAGTDYSDRVNAAFAVGGPDQLVATVQRTLGITINHYVQVDFGGFKDIVDTVGGVTMYVPYPVRDRGSGLDLGRADCFELDGNKALSWVRSRNMEFLIDGVWQADGRGDLGRIERQQDFIRRMMKKALSSGLTNPLTLNRLIGVGVKDVTFDSALSTKDLTTLGRRFSSLDPERVALQTLPTDPADIDGKAVLKLQTAQAQPIIDMLNGVAAPTGDPIGDSIAVDTSSTTTVPTGTVVDVKPSTIRVRILNGAGTAGLAGRTGTGLTSTGYVVVEKGDAPAPAPKTTINYGVGQLAKAETLSRALLSPAVIKEDATLKTVDVSIVLGVDFVGLKATVSSGSGLTSTTTIAPTTTTAIPAINPVPLPKGTTVAPC